MEKQTSRIHQWRREGVEQRLLGVAEHLITTRGPGQVSLALVARAAGVSRATTYNYFGDQRGLLTKFAAHRFHELESILDPIVSSKELGPREQLGTLILESVAFFERSGRFFRIMVRERADLIIGGPHDGLTAAISDGMTQYVARLTAPLKEGMKQGLFVGEDPERMAWAIAGMITHAVLRILEHPSAKTRAAEVGIMEAIIFHAVLEGPSPGLRRHLQALSAQRAMVSRQVRREIPAGRWQQVKSAVLVATLSTGIIGCAARQARVGPPDLQTRVATLERRLEVVETRQQDLENKAWDVAYLRDRVESAEAPRMEQVVVTAPGETAPTFAGGPAITEIQLALRRAGYYDGPIDGKAGHNTTKAIKEFQRTQRLKVDGKVGPKTWAALSRHLSSSGSHGRSK